MPIYEYQCGACGTRFELRQGFDAATVHACTKCGQPAQRRIHAPPVIFKGSGWYVTDYANKNPIATSPEEKPESKASDDKPSAGHGDDHGHSHDAPAPAKTEAKTEAKSESKASGAKPEPKAAAKTETKAPATTKNGV